MPIALPVMKNYINDEWVESKSTTFGNVWNPARAARYYSDPAELAV